MADVLAVAAWFTLVHLMPAVSSRAFSQPAAGLGAAGWCHPGTPWEGWSGFATMENRHRRIQAESQPATSYGECLALDCGNCFNLKVQEASLLFIRKTQSVAVSQLLRYGGEWA